MSKKILITGGAGFIGSNFIRLLTDRNEANDIVVLDKLTYAGNLDNIADLIKKKRITFVQGDIADKAFIFDFFKKERFALVINFAAETHVDRSLIEPAIFVMTNVVGTQTLLDACQQFGVKRFHQVSTDEVYGDLGDNSKDFFTENIPLNPTSPYAASKAAADMLVISAWKTHKLPITISRCSNNYGPYQFPEKLIPYFFQLASQEKPLPLYGDGKNIRDWLFVQDHCEAIQLILEKSPPGEIYNIGGNFERDNTSIAKLILKFLGKSEKLITYVEDRLAHDRRYAIDPSKIEQKLGWKPRHTFQQGIKKTFEWYEKNKAWWEKIIKKHKIDENRKHLSIRKISKSKLPISKKP
ncbi:dTDP-glucose 4,6-dehydratase [Candidatus Peregrinibacteria bacterium]|nr:dTDP-glucose 4,6-dehydratase [Candidatus Peregrinibacteria bacterium]